MSARTFWLNLGPIVVLVVTVAVPLILDAFGRLTYFTSLVLWGIPILYLWPLFTTITAAGSGRRRRALRWTAAAIVGLGVVLDFLLGHLTLRFPGCAEPPGSRPYVWCLPAVGGLVPIEELLFYALGPVAIILVYACADERWLSRYNPPDEPVDVALIRVSPRLVTVAAFAALAALALWRVNGTFPAYFVFLAAGALLPAIFFYRTIGGRTNWPAFGITMLYVMVTSVIWEVTLAIPREWWGYEPSGMAGLTIAAWSRGDAIFPVEAAAVWLFAPFSCALSYEFAKAFTHHRGSAKAALFGARAGRSRDERAAQSPR